MKQVVVQEGQPMLEEVPAPCADKGQVLVQVEYSCIYLGTELSEMCDETAPLWKQALKNPHKVKSFVAS